MAAFKVSFVYPHFNKFLTDNRDIDRGLVDYYLGDFTTPPSLGIPIMASWTPDDIAVELLDDNSGDAIDYSAPTDLVAINCFTPQATRAFAIADEFRRHDKKVIMGGFFPSFMVEECLEHADAVNTGEVEPTWLQILEDARNGELKRVYHGGNSFDLSRMRIPRRDIFYSKKSYTWEEDLVQITRGCNYNCAMCAIPNHMGFRIRLRPIEHVVEEMKTLKFENVYLADDTLFFPQRKIVEYSTELFKALAPLKKKYFVASTMALKTDPAFFDIAAEAGVCNFYCTMNVDPVSIRAIQGDPAAVRQLIDLVAMLRDRNIRFFGSFAIGREWDDNSIADRILELYHKADIRTSEFFLFTPYPGSKQWERLDRQGRIFDKNWSHYNGAHLVADHPVLSRDELYGQFVKVWNEFFTIQKERHAADLEPLTYKEGRKSVGIPLQESGVPGQAVITGIGVYSPVGNSEDEIAATLDSGVAAIRKAEKIDASFFRTDLVGEIQQFDPHEFLSDDELEEYEDEYLRYAISAARKALKNAETDVDSETPLVLATCNGGLLSAEREYAWKHGRAQRPFDEKMNLQAQYYGFGKALSAALGITGEVWLVTTACSSSTVAAGLAQMIINKGYAKKLLVVASDMLCKANVAGFDALKAVSEAQTAPFSLPVGLNVGEAAVCWVVEEMESAVLRHAYCKAKLAGYATTSDAYHPTAPDPRGDGVYRTLSSALARSGLLITDLGVINTHGTGTDANDLPETKGIVRFLGGEMVPAVSLKSFHGHCMGATGLLEATENIVAMARGFIPPTVNFSQPRPGCRLDHVPNTPRKRLYDTFISANYAFGGNNAAVVVTAWNKEIGKVKRINGRVVITGAASATSLGMGNGPLLDALFSRTRGFSEMKRFSLEKVKSRKAGFINDFNGREIDRRIDFRAMNPIAAFATAASKLALDHAGLKIGRATMDCAGIAMGICNGSDEMPHMDAVFSAGQPGADIASFSNITANSVAGWVSNALLLKGANITLSPGHHASLQALSWAFDALSEQQATVMIAAGADEVYQQTYFNYDLMNFLYHGDDESNYRLNTAETTRKVLGEGSGALVLETLEAAQARNAALLGEVLAYGMSMDAMRFSNPATDSDSVVRAVEKAVRRAGIEKESIDMVVWAPQGNRQDLKVTEGVKKALNRGIGEIPFITTVFNTGYIESASVLVSLSAALSSLTEQRGIWPQMTGIPQIDTTVVGKDPRVILAVGSSDTGYSHAVLVRRGN
ncbi:MAG: radical SAM protein [Chitinispirillaceae bacterium]|nr:radical SAM protein [Chitinispirillaceae bacterium]